MSRKNYTECSRTTICTCASCLGTRVKDLPCDQDLYADTAARIKASDFGASKPEISVSGYTGRTHHPLASIAEWRKGCSCAPKEFPVQCEARTEGLIKAIESWFTQGRNTSTDVLKRLQSYLIADARSGGKRKSTEMVNLAHQHIEDLDAQLYAAQDQVTGLQEPMAAPKAPPLCPCCGTHEVSLERTCHNSSCTSYAEPETIWEGWKTFQEYAATDIAAEAQVLEPKPGDVWALPVDLIIQLQALPQAVGHPKEALDKLGIRYETYWGNPLTGSVALFNCTNVPVDLPEWLSLRTKP